MLAKKQKNVKASYMTNRELPDLETIEVDGAYRVLDLHSDINENKKAKKRLVYAGAMIPAAAAGAVAGFEAANYLVPVHIDYLNGLGVDVSLSTHAGISVDTLNNTIQDPHLHFGTGIPGMHGVHAAVTNFSPPKGSSTEFFGQMAGLVSDLQDRVIAPTHDLLATHLKEGAGIGMLSATALAALIVNRVQARQEAEKALEAKITELRRDHATTESQTSARVADGLEADLINNRQKRRRKRIIASVSAVAIGVMGMSNKEVRNFDSAPQRSNTITLNNDVTKDIPELKNVELTGFFGQLTNTLAYGVVQYKQETDSAWKKDAKQITKSFNRFASGPGSTLINNPDEEPIEQVSDIHCNYSNEENYLPTVNKLFKAPLILVTGDTQTNSGTMFYEKDCFNNFIKGVKAAAFANKMNIQVIIVAGNHDDKKPINEDLGNVKLRTLTNSNPTIVAGGIRSIGTQDPEQTVWYPTLPSNPLDQIKVIGQQGDNLANLACKYFNSDEGLPVVVMAHEHQALAQTIKNGCADATLDGHTHDNGDVESYTGDNGHIVLHHTVGSASGAGTVGTPYQPPQKDATETIMYFNKATKKFDAFITPIAHANETTEIEDQHIPLTPKPAEESDWISSTLNEYHEVSNR
jgi:hypothetical protein